MEGDKGQARHLIKSLSYNIGLIKGLLKASDVQFVNSFIGTEVAAEMIHRFLGYKTV